MSLIEVERNDRFAVYKLHDGAQLAVLHPPEVGADELHRCASLVKGAMDAFANLDEARRAVAADPQLSPVGKIEKVAAQRQQVAGQITKALEELEQFGKNIQEFEAKTYAPPALDPGDAVGALTDMELRQFLRAQKGADKGSAYAEIGANPRLQAAVLRSPVPLPSFTDLAQKCWSRHVEATSPDATKVKHFRAAHEWASAILPQLERHVS